MAAWSKETLLNLLGRVAERYEAPRMRAYALGGTALTLTDLKPSTVDVDLAFEDRKDAEAFASALRYSGLEELAGLEVYWIEGMGLIVAESKRTRVRLDLYAGRVYLALLSPGMRERSRSVDVLKWLELRALTLEDVTLLKLAAGREKDRDDLILALRLRKIDWGVVASELDWQVGNSPWGEELASRVASSLEEWPEIPVPRWFRRRLMA